MTVSKLAPGMGCPLMLTVRQFNGLCSALIDDDADSNLGDHRAKVEADMRRLAHGRR